MQLDSIGAVKFMDCEYPWHTAQHEFRILLNPVPDLVYLYDLQ